MKKLGLVIAVVMVFGITSTAFAQNPTGPGDCCSGAAAMACQNPTLVNPNNAAIWGGCPEPTAGTPAGGNGTACFAGCIDLTPDPSKAGPHGCGCLNGSCLWSDGFSDCGSAAANACTAGATNPSLGCGLN